LRNRRRLRGVEIGTGDGRAGLGEGLRDRAADAVSGAGDQGDFSGERRISHGILLPLNLQMFN
jgi:hypothetical protein